METTTLLSPLWSPHLLSSAYSRLVPAAKQQAMRSMGPLENYSAAMCGELALKAWWEDGRRRSAWAMGLERQLLSWDHLVHGQKGASL